MKRNILIISPHADDMELGCGGYVSKAVMQGCQVRNVVVATGTIIHQRQGLAVTMQQREVELRESLKTLGVQSYSILFEGLDTKLDTIPIVEIVKKLEREVKDFNPTEIFIPLPSAHQDHNRTYEACLAALRPSVMSHQIELIASYEYPASGWGDCTFLDNGKSGMYVDVTHYLDKKLDSLRCYTSQITTDKHCFSLDAATTMARMRGIECGMEYAEMFRIMRRVVR